MEVYGETGGGVPQVPVNNLDCNDNNSLPPPPSPNELKMINQQGKKEAKRSPQTSPSHGVNKPCIDDGGNTGGEVPANNHALQTAFMPSPEDNLNNEFFFDDEFSVQFDVNLGDGEAEGEVPILTDVQLNEILQRCDANNVTNKRLASSKSDSTLYHADMSTSEGGDTSLEQSLNSEQDIGSSSELSELNSEPLFSPTPPANQDVQGILSTDSLAAVTSIMGSFTNDHYSYDWRLNKDQYTISFAGSIHKGSDGESNQSSCATLDMNTSLTNWVKNIPEHLKDHPNAKFLWGMMTNSVKSSKPNSLTNSPTASPKKALTSWGQKATDVKVDQASSSKPALTTWRSLKEMRVENPVEPAGVRSKSLPELSRKQRTLSGGSDGSDSIQGDIWNEEDDDTEEEQESVADKKERPPSTLYEMFTRMRSESSMESREDVVSPSAVNKMMGTWSMSPASSKNSLSGNEASAEGDLHPQYQTPKLVSWGGLNNLARITPSPDQSTNSAKAGLDDIDGQVNSTAKSEKRDCSTQHESLEGRDCSVQTSLDLESQHLQYMEKAQQTSLMVFEKEIQRRAKQWMSILEIPQRAVLKYLAMQYANDCKHNCPEKKTSPIVTGKSSSQVFWSKSSLPDLSFLNKEVPLPFDITSVPPQTHSSPLKKSPLKSRHRRMSPEPRARSYSPVPHHTQHSSHSRDSSPSLSKGRHSRESSPVVKGHRTSDNTSSQSFCSSSSSGIDPGSYDSQTKLNNQLFADMVAPDNHSLDAQHEHAFLNSPAKGSRKSHCNYELPRRLEIPQKISDVCRTCNGKKGALGDDLSMTGSFPAYRSKQDPTKTLHYLHISPTRRSACSHDTNVPKVAAFVSNAEFVCCDGKVSQGRPLKSCLAKGKLHHGRKHGTFSGSCDLTVMKYSQEGQTQYQLMASPSEEECIHGLSRKSVSHAAKTGKPESVPEKSNKAISCACAQNGCGGKFTNSPDLIPVMPCACQASQASSHGSDDTIVDETANQQQQQQEKQIQQPQEKKQPQTHQERRQQQYRAKKSVSFSEHVSYHSPYSSPHSSPVKQKRVAPNVPPLDLAAPPLRDLHPDDWPVSATDALGCSLDSAMPIPIHHNQTWSSTHSAQDGVDGGEPAPQDFCISPSASPPTSFIQTTSSKELAVKKDLVMKMMRGTELILTYFSGTKDSYQKMSMGSTAHSAEIGHLVLQYLCPAVYAVLNDGLKPYTRSVFGQVRNSVWAVVEDSVSLGPTTHALQQLTSDLKQLGFLSTTWLKFNAFIFGLMNQKALDFWLTYIHTQDRLLQKHYEPDSFLVTSTNVARPLFRDMVAALQPLTRLPFRLEYTFEYKLLEQRHQHALAEQFLSKHVSHALPSGEELMQRHQARLMHQNKKDVPLPGPGHVMPQNQCVYQATAERKGCQVHTHHPSHEVTTSACSDDEPPLLHHVSPHSSIDEQNLLATGPYHGLPEEDKNILGKLKDQAQNIKLDTINDTLPINPLLAKPSSPKSPPGVPELQGINCDDTDADTNANKKAAVPIVKDNAILVPGMDESVEEAKSGGILAAVTQHLQPALPPERAYKKGVTEYEFDVKKPMGAAGKMEQEAASAIELSDWTNDSGIEEHQSLSREPGLLNLRQAKLVERDPKKRWSEGEATALLADSTGKTESGISQVKKRWSTFGPRLFKFFDKLLVDEKQEQAAGECTGVADESVQDNIRNERKDIIQAKAVEPASTPERQVRSRLPVARMSPSRSVSPVKGVSGATAGVKKPLSVTPGAIPPPKPPRVQQYLSQSKPVKTGEKKATTEKPAIAKRQRDVLASPKRVATVNTNLQTKVASSAEQKHKPPVPPKPVRLTELSPQKRHVSRQVSKLQDKPLAARVNSPDKTVQARVDSGLNSSLIPKFKINSDTKKDVPRQLKSPTKSQLPKAKPRRIPASNAKTRGAGNSTVTQS